MKNLNPAFTLTRSFKRNAYVYDPNIQKMIFCHPVLYHLLQLHKDGIDVERFVRGIGGQGTIIGSYGRFSRNDVEYYYAKYLMLKANGYFKNSSDAKKNRKRWLARMLLS